MNSTWSITIGCIMMVSMLNSQPLGGKVKGLTLVASPNAVEREAFEPIHAIGANWVAINPFAFSSSESNTAIVYDHPRQWWGERPDGIRDAIKKAQEACMQIMLKPQVWIPNGWVGHVFFEQEDKWQEWQKEYTRYILDMAVIAADYEIELFCIGTEYDQAVIYRPQFWCSLLDTVRTIYSGSITYASNWTHFHEIDFWDDLDYIGIDAYFPLSDERLPEVDELKAAWQEQQDVIEQVSSRFEKQVLFTEYGYLSVDGCAGRHWILEPKRHHVPINEAGQANAYEALLTTFMPEDWYAGGFLWKWYPDEKSRLGEGDHKRDYTPQGKQSEQVLKTIFNSYE